MDENFEKQVVMKANQKLNPKLFLWKKICKFEIYEQYIGTYSRFHDSYSDRPVIVSDREWM